MNLDDSLGGPAQRGLLGWLRLDPPLLTGLLLLIALGLVVLYSASGQSEAVVIRQGIRIGLGLAVMLVFARLGVHKLYLWAPALYVTAFVLLVLVLVAGDTGKGAQRWLNLGFVRFQPAELMKLAMPLMLAFHFAERRLPPTWQDLALALGLVFAPVVLIFLQPDLGTALLIGWSGLVVIFAAGIRWRTILLTAVAALAAAPVLWHFMHDYQRRRVLNFLNPESDPLGAGYHLIQSKIAIGAGGLYGRGWLEGSQAQLKFLPERTTDFIFAVFGEEFGLVGVLALFALYLFITLRGLYIAVHAKDTFSRLLAASLSMTFFIYFFVNVGMVSGLLPVVGVPLPLVSYGGTSIVTLLAGFGMLMAIQNERRLVAK